MKKVYIIILIISLVYTKAATQSFSLQNPNNNLQDTASFIPIEGTVYVVNNSGSAKDVMMYRMINNLAPTHSSYFCWGINCYGPSVDTSLYSESILPNDSSLARADLNPYDSAGYSEVTYCWYDINNPADSVCLTFTYDVLPRLTGINELTATVDFISLSHPNPADLSTVLIYNLKNHDANLVLCNVIGEKVLEVKLDNSKQDVRLNTSSFHPGIYFYSLISDGKVISTNKLVVSHKN